MTIWPPHDAMTRAEASIMSSIRNNFISTKTAGPVNGQVQDSLFGSAELTRGGVALDKFHAMAVFNASGLAPPRFERLGGAAAGGARFSGRELASMLFAHAPVNYNRAPSFFSELYASAGMRFAPDDIRVVMERGVLRSGVLDKDAVGPKKEGGLFHLVSHEYGPQAALDLIFAWQQMTVRALENIGMTAGCFDILLSAPNRAEVHRLTAGVLLESQHITERLVRGEIIPPIGKTTHQFYEELQINALRANDRSLMQCFLGSINPETNGLFKMVAYGSKGNNANLIHICCLINQILINAERIREQFSFRRTLPYFPRFATDARAFGFMTNSYASGMTSPEFIFNDMNGRFDLINKALTTATTGYFMRKGVMNNQSALVDNLRRVSKDTRVVQLLYGDDGLDTRQIKKVQLRSVPMADAALAAAFRLDVAAAGLEGSAAELAAAQAAADAAFARVRADRDEFRALAMRIERCNFRLPFSFRVSAPVDVASIVRGAFLAAADAASGAPPAPAARARAAELSRRIARVADFCDCSAYALVNEAQERLRSPLPAHLRAAVFVFNMLLRTELAPPTLARLSDEQLAYVLKAVKARHAMALIAYGTAVGILAAQAISEPLTQYMLDSHHRSVQGGTNKSGLVRVSEIYGARPVEDEQSPAMLLPLRREFAADAAKAQEIANGIELVTLRRFVRQYDILFEPFAAPQYPPFAADLAWMREFADAHPLAPAPPDLTSWCFRLVCDKSAMVLKAMPLEAMVARLRAAFPSLFVVHTPESVPSVVVRVYVRSAQFKRGPDDEERARELLDALLDTMIRGVRGILSARVEKSARTVVGADGALGREAGTFAIATSGTNLYGAVMNKFVDPLLAISSSIGDTFKFLGVEAARNKIITETRAFMESGTPDLRHPMLYASEMTRTGRVTAIERGGLAAREKNNTLLRAAASAPIQVLSDAALSGAKSKVYGISAPLALGQTPNIGTLYNSFVVDEAFVAANAKSVDSVLDDL